MRIRICIALLPLVPVTAVAQTQPADPPGVYHVRKLSLECTDLPRAQRQAIVQAFQGGTYIIDALAERVRAKLRESGYELAEVNPLKSLVPATRSTRAMPTLHSQFALAINTALPELHSAPMPVTPSFLPLGSGPNSLWKMAPSSKSPSSERDSKT